MAGYEEPLHALASQLAAYEEFLRTTVLPRARADFALPPAVYALRLERAGVDLPQDQLVALAHEQFAAIQGQMKGVAAEVARARGLPSADYRDVLRELKKEQLVGEAILPHYRQRLADVEAIIRREHLVTLPARPARIRLATSAESAQQPAPHMDPPRLIGNTGEQGEFVLPLSMPAPTGASGREAEQKYDDFTFAAASWTLTAHEVRPGHELQFDSMVERGVSIARARYAFNSANVEGWGLYAEAITLPFMPPEGQLVSLAYRLHRAARAFLDPELQQGKWSFDSARDFLEKEVGLSPAFATSEVERYTFRMPGQATSYFYGFTRLMALRHEAEQRLGRASSPRRSTTPSSARACYRRTCSATPCSGRWEAHRATMWIWLIAILIIVATWARRDAARVAASGSILITCFAALLVVALVPRALRAGAAQGPRHRARDIVETGAAASAFNARLDRRAEIAHLQAQMQRGLYALRAGPEQRRGGERPLSACLLGTHRRPWRAWQDDRAAPVGPRLPCVDPRSGRGMRGIGGTRNCDWWFTNDAILLDTRRALRWPWRGRRLRRVDRLPRHAQAIRVVWRSPSTASSSPSVRDGLHRGARGPDRRHRQALARADRRGGGSPAHARARLRDAHEGRPHRGLRGDVGRFLRKKSAARSGG